jgi:DNA-binding transcriptional regulator YiaG
MKKEFLYQGLGFPVLLTDVETEEHDGEELPLVNHRRLEEAVFEQLTITPERLTGVQLAWIRGFMGLSQSELAKHLAFNSHATISVWEAQASDVTGMDARTEYCLRLEMCRYVHAKSDALVKDMPSFMDMKQKNNLVKILKIAA